MVEENKEEPKTKTLPERLREIESMPKNQRIYVSPQLYKVLNSHRAMFFFPTINLFLEALFDVKNSPRLNRILRQREIWKLQRELKEAKQTTYSIKMAKRDAKKQAQIDELKRKLIAWRDENKPKDKQDNQDSSIDLLAELEEEFKEK